MTLDEALIKIFTSCPERHMIGNTVKSLLHAHLGYSPIDSEYYHTFKTLRDTYVGEDGRRILKIWNYNHWVYTYSNNKQNIKKHNQALDKLANNALKGKIAYQ